MHGSNTCGSGKENSIVFRLVSSLVNSRIETGLATRLFDDDLCFRSNLVWVELASGNDRTTRRSNANIQLLKNIHESFVD